MGLEGLGFGPGLGPCTRLRFRLVSGLEEDTGAGLQTPAVGPAGAPQVVQEAPARPAGPRRRRQTSRTASPAPPRAAGSAAALVSAPETQCLPRAARQSWTGPAPGAAAAPQPPSPRLGSGPWGARAGGRPEQEPRGTRVRAGGAPRRPRWGPCASALGCRPGEPLCNRGERERVGGLPPSTSSGGGARDRRGTAEPAPAWVASGPTDLLQLGGLHLGAGGVLKSLQRLSRAPPRALLLISHWPRWALGL